MSATIIILDSLTMAPTPDLFAFPYASASYAPEATATEHPVERGVVVTDHVQVRPDRLTVDAYVTTSPRGIALPGGLDGAIAFLKRALGKVCTVVVDGEGTFTPYVLEGSAHTRTAKGGRGFALRLKQIRVASALSVSIPPRTPAPVAATGAATELPLDAQPTVTGTPASLPVASPATAAGGSTSGLKFGADFVKSFITGQFSPVVP